MSQIYKDVVQETTTTTGTGTLTLAGAVTGCQSFAAVGNGNGCEFETFEVDANGNRNGAWEVARGTYTSSGTTLSRTTVLSSSNSGSAVSFAAGTKRVALVLSANAITNPDQLAALVDPEQSITTTTTLTSTAFGQRYVCSGTSANYTVTLPDPTSHTNEHVEFRMDSALTKLVTLDAGAGKSIEGKSTTLSAAITTTSATSLTVTSASGFPAVGTYLVQIDSELLLVTAGQGTTTWTVTRGVGGTTAATHTNGTAVDWQRTRVLYANEAAKFRAASSTTWARVTGRSVPMTAKIHHRTTATTLVNNTFTKVTLETALWDAGSISDTTNSRIAVRRAGKYAVQTGLSCDVFPAGSTIILSVYVNGVEVDRLFRVATGSETALLGTANSYPNFSVGTTLDLLAGDYVEAWVYQNSGASRVTLADATASGLHSFLAVTEVPT